MTVLTGPPPRIQSDTACTAALVDAIISLLSVQPPDSPVHDVTQYRDGFYIPFDLICRPPNPPERFHIYALPWSRGWSVFTLAWSPGYIKAVGQDPGPHWWRYAPQRLKGLQQPIFNPRDTLGPHQVSAERIVTAILDILDKLERLNRARLNRYRKERWYWPSSALNPRTNANSNSKKG